MTEPDPAGKVPMKTYFRADVELKQGSNAPDAYKGAIRNRERMGLDDAGYKAVWDRIPFHGTPPIPTTRWRSSAHT